MTAIEGGEHWSPPLVNIVRTNPRSILCRPKVARDQSLNSF